MSIVVPGHIRYATLTNAVVLLDLATGVYSALAPEHVELWGALLDGRAPVSPEEKERLESFGAAMIDRGLLAEAPAPAGARCLHETAATHRGTTLAAVVALLHTDRALRRSGFAGSYRSLQRLAGGDRTPPDRSTGCILESFIRAESILWWRRRRDDCLPRSFALYRFCRGAGLDVGHVMGVRANPFQAHAWVVHQGHPLLDSPEKTEPYTPIAVL